MVLVALWTRFCLKLFLRTRELAGRWNSSYNIHVQLAQAELMKQASWIVWNETSMSSRYAVEARALDHVLQDVMGNRQTFGNKVLLLFGGFRRILPIIPRDINDQVLQQCIRLNMLLGKFRVLRVRENMRMQTAQTVQDAEEPKEFAEFLLRISVWHMIFPGFDKAYAKIPRDLILPGSYDSKGKANLSQTVWFMIKNYWFQQVHQP